MTKHNTELVFTICLLVILFLITATVMLYYYNQRNQCQNSPSFNCFNDWVCQDGSNPSQLTQIAPQNCGEDPTPDCINAHNAPCGPTCVNGNLAPCYIHNARHSCGATREL